MERLRSVKPKIDRSHGDRVIVWLKKTELDPATTLVMGESALALAGIRAAGDLDLMVPWGVYKDLEWERQTPSGLALRQKTFALHPSLETAPLPEMPQIDITHPYDDDDHDQKGSPKLDTVFLEALDKFDDRGGYRYLLPSNSTPK